MGLLIRGESVSYTHLTAAEGNGPVNAMDIALRKAILQFFPELERVSLVDYKVRILDSHSATGAIVRVLIESTDGQMCIRDRSYSTVSMPIRLPLIRMSFGARKSK